MLVPKNYVFPLSILTLESIDLPVPGDTKVYLEHILGYLGEDAVLDIETGRWLQQVPG